MLWVGHSFFTQKTQHTLRNGCSEKAVPKPAVFVHRPREEAGRYAGAHTNFVALTAYSLIPLSLLPPLSALLADCFFLLSVDSIFYPTSRYSTGRVASECATP